VRISTVLLALLLALPGLARAAEPDIDVDPDGEIGLVDWGLYSARDVGAVKSDTTVEGLWHEVTDVNLVLQTVNICAGDGTMFGLRYRLTDKVPEPSWELEVQTAHPMLFAPSGRSGNSGFYATALTRGTTGYTGWTVRYPYEHVPGDYTFTLLHDGHVKLRKTFHLEFECVPATS
jgi:hypothetical protein